MNGSYACAILHTFAKDLVYTGDVKIAHTKHLYILYSFFKRNYNGFRIILNLDI